MLAFVSILTPPRCRHAFQNRSSGTTLNVKYCQVAVVAINLLPPARAASERAHACGQEARPYVNLGEGSKGRAAERAAMRPRLRMLGLL